MTFGKLTPSVILQLAFCQAKTRAALTRAEFCIILKLVGRDREHTAHEGRRKEGKVKKGTLVVTIVIVVSLALGYFAGRQQMKYQIHRVTTDELTSKPSQEVETAEFVEYDTPPAPKHWSKPKYPETAKKAGIEGMVVLKILVGTDGSVVDVQVLKSAHPALDQAASDAAKQWTFSPAKLVDEPVKTWVSFPVKFSLTES